eukprot:7514387-Pyramimonas_sp.AAC.1
MDSLRSGVGRAEFLQGHWQLIRREEETPNAEWGYFINLLSTDKFFAQNVQRSADYPQKSHKMLSLLAQRCNLRQSLAAA